MTQVIEIHPTEPTSTDALALLAAGHKAMQAQFPEKRKMDFSVDALMGDQVELLLAYRNEGPIGCCAVSIETDYAELKRLFVAPEMRGHGVAELLVRRVEHVSRNRRRKKVMLESGARLLAAHRLYLRLGYERRGVFGMHKNLSDSLFFEKTVAP